MEKTIRVSEPEEEHKPQRELVQSAAVRNGRASTLSWTARCRSAGKPRLEAPLSRPGTTTGNRRYLHEHRPQLQKVVVLRVLHLHDAPRVEAASDLLAFGFNQLIGSNHRERDAGLEGDTRGRLALHGEPQLSLQTQAHEQKMRTVPLTAGLTAKA